jgi:hypothetical protein
MHQRADEANLPSDRDGMTVCKDADLAVQGATGQQHKRLSGITPSRTFVGSRHVRLIGPSRPARAFPDLVNTRSVRPRATPVGAPFAGRPA